MLRARRRYVGVMRRTPLYDEHVAAGARMVEFAGFEMPVQYASIVEEHLAVRTSCGVFDVSHMGELLIEGPRALECVSRVFSNDAATLEPGRAQYSLIPNERGGIVDDVIVYRLGDESFFVCVNASNAAKDFEWVRSHAPASGCTVLDVGAEYALIAVQGPDAVDLVDELLPGAAALDRFAFFPARVRGRRALVARTGYTGEDGFEIFIDTAAAVGLWRELCERGAAEAGLGARDTLRLEAALPLYGHELGEAISPYEARVGWAVKLNREDMIGYEALCRAKADPAKRRTVGLVMETGIAREGCAVLASGVRIGAVTSGTHGPTVGRGVALALIDRDPAGLVLAVDVRGKVRNARVTPLPFYVRQAPQARGE
jgi:aminomethyltransferase